MAEEKKAFSSESSSLSDKFKITPPVSSSGTRLLRRFRSRARINPPHPAIQNVEKANQPEEAGDYPKRGQPVPCRLEDVVDKLATKHKGAREFPQFDSLEAYQVDIMTQRELRKEEARKLVDVIKDPARPVALASDDLLRRISCDSSGYKIVSLMSRSITTALSLCLLDNECINARSCPQIANRQRIGRLVKQAEVAARCPLTDILALLPGSDEDELLKATLKLVDYIAAVLARLVCQTASGSFWIENVTAVLAARLTKMKFLLMGLSESALVAAQNGADTLEYMQKSGDPSENLEDEEEECEEALRIIEANTKDGLASEDEAAVSSYCVSQNQFRSGINTAMKHILVSLHFVNRSTLPPGTFEICGIVYEIGFEGFKTVLFQDKDLQYSASSDRSVLNTGHPALCMLDQTLRELAEQMATRPSNVSSRPESETCVEWAYQEHTIGSPSSTPSGVDYAELRRSMKSLTLRHLGDIITVAVPLALMSPVLLADFTTFRTTMALAGGMQDVVSPLQEGHFGAFCRLYTTRFDAEASKRNILRLSAAFDQGQFSRCKLSTQRKRRSAAKKKDNTRTTPGQEKLIRDQLDDCCADMQHWVVDESSVTVSCRLYVASVMLVAIIFAGGGLTMGFTIGQRIKGVDPFGLATYAWVLAAFALLIAKSIKVEDWSWRDFLSCHVRCRSVSELAAATGVHEQLVMAKLLHDDCGGSILKTRGPYNSVFRSQGDSGFSIDRPLSAATLILSGLALLKVVTPRGDAIVCLDCRRGTYLSVVEHSVGQDSSRLVCDDLNRVSSGVRRRSQEPLKLRLANRGDFKWKRVQGLYDFKGQVVVFE